MDKAKEYRGKLFLLFIATIIFILCFTMRTPRSWDEVLPKPHGPPQTCPSWVSRQTITPLNNTRHLLVSAYMDQRTSGYDIRIIGMFKKDSLPTLYCFFCCAGHLSATSTPASVSPHYDNFGFPFITTDVLCRIPPSCQATHVSLQTEETEGLNHTWLPIRNLKEEEQEENKFKYNFTVCISSLFGEYNNVLQFAQSLEMYRLLGVDRVVIYKTSSGLDVDRLLQVYSREGLVEVVPWPIDQHLKPSAGWLFSQSGGDVHYYGQLTTLNECIYRSMQRSRYVLLNDVDEIIMPYKHNHLTPLMETLQQQHPDTGVFLIENHIFPRKHFEPSGRFHLPQWKDVPGVNILEHIYREEPDRKIYHPHKMIVQPRLVERTSVHEVLKSSGERVKVPMDVCRIIHVRVALQGSLTREQLREDTRLWDFQEKLIPNVDKALQRAGLLSPETQI